MSLESVHDNESAVDQATASRLAKLRALPVDLGRLRLAMEREIPRSRRFDLRLMAGRWAAVAGVVFMLGLGIVTLNGSSGSAAASPVVLARVYDDMTAGHGVMQVDSLEQANQMLAGNGASMCSMPGGQVACCACCMRKVASTDMACMLLKDQGQPIAVTLCGCSEMSMPDGDTQIRDGVKYQVQSTGSLNMVMTQRHGRWVCLMGKVPAGRLMEIAGQLQF